jgi:hypothetical protein
VVETGLFLGQFKPNAAPYEITAVKAANRRGLSMKLSAVSAVTILRLSD